MSTATILVIDDSATIRKMVNSHLSQEGYRVVLAPNAEIGLATAPELQPNLILLDHQLPGTTGIEVCRKIIADPRCSHIPFVVSSTLRKQAYIEYMDVPNVVDSLPKPFKPELLKSTIANALEVGAMIVASQSDGTAVPEVVDEVADCSLAGDFSWVSLRELLDFLNNGNKKGLLEVEMAHDRVWFFLAEGRIQTVVSASMSPEKVAEQLPESLVPLAPLLKFTMSSGFTSQLDGFVELLDKKVLDPRMLRTLLRFQAAFLTMNCMQGEVKSFNFFADRELPPLFRRTPLQISLAGLLIEAATNKNYQPTDHSSEQIGWIRKGLRGQNLDRSGLSAKHLQILSVLGAEPIPSKVLAEKVGVEEKEVHRVLEGLMLADWVASKKIESGLTIVALESDPEGSNLIHELFASDANDWNGKVVRDEFGLQLLLNRNSADLLAVEVSGDEQLSLPQALVQKAESFLSHGTLGLILPEEANAESIAPELSTLPRLQRPYTQQQITDFFAALKGSAQSSGLQSANGINKKPELQTAGQE